MMSSKMYAENPEVMWTPNEDSGHQTKEFMEIIQRKYKVKLDNYWDLHKWSVQNHPEFWGEVWDFAEIVHSKTYDKVVDRDAQCGDRPLWFQGAMLNFSENVLKYRDDHVALIVTGEERLPKMVTHAQLYEEACLYGAALRKLGVKKGDCVACVMPNREEPIYAVLGAASIGATWTGALPLLGTKAVLNRFKLTEPIVLFTVDRFRNTGEEHEMLEKIKEVANELPSLKKVVIVPSTLESRLKDISQIKNSCFLEEFLEAGRNEDGSVPPLEFEQLPFHHPVFISYTSGTTGEPKVLVHGVGSLITTIRDFLIQLDTSRENVLLSTTPAGWVSWIMHTSLLALGISIVVFEGVPFFLSPTYLWDIVEEFKISNLLLTPNILDELEKREYLPSPESNLNSLKYIISGASVVKPQNYDFVYKKVKPNVIFGGCYGSTELICGSMAIQSILPIHKGEIPAPVVGNQVECFNDSGQSVVGEVGELVFTIPTPSLPLCLLGDEDGTKYREIYCSKFPGVFCPGDLCLINPVTKGIIMCGRSDETMKQKGARFGCAEIYNVVDMFEQVSESLCVAQFNCKRDERAVLFIKMKGGYKFDEELVRKIRLAIEKELTKRHVPEIILETKDIPRNVNGKKAEILVKKIINNMPYTSETVVNPDSLKYYENVPELHGF